MKSIEWPKRSGRIYTCQIYIGNVLRVTAKPGATEHVAIAGEQPALQWLCDHSLKRSKAQKLIDSVLRPETTFA